MKHTLSLILLLILLSTACNLSAPTATPIPPTASTGAGSGNEPASSSGDAPLYFTTMTHMEGSFLDDRDQDVFLGHVAQLRYGMNLANEYDAILTIESEKPFARANAKWNLNIMAEIQQGGHGVGTHCDIGFKDPPLSVEQYAAAFRENKLLVDALVGAENNLGCSGGGSVNDWALAASLAGFKYLDGIVSMHYLSMPIENRPGPEWTDDYIRNGHFHFNAPVDLSERIYLLGVANAQDFVADPNPVIVISSGELGLLSAIAEGGRETSEMANHKKGDEFLLTNEDVDALVALIREVDQSRDRKRVAKLAVYLPSNVFDPQNEAVLRYFFGRMQELAGQGLITWATQRQAYEAYTTWR
jgi:hypothetical protein